jgi:hypothetical protein
MRLEPCVERQVKKVTPGKAVYAFFDSERNQAARGTERVLEPRLRRKQFRVHKMSVECLEEPG